MPAFLAAILPALGSVLSSGISAVGGLGIKALATIPTMALSAVRSVVGVAVSVVGAAVSAVAQTIGSIPQMLLGTVSALLGGVSNAAGAIIKVGTLLGGVFLGGLTGAAAGLKILTAASIEYAKNVRTISAQTGLGLDASAGLLNRNSAIGISNEATAGAFGNQNPAIFGMKANLFGLPRYDAPDFAARFAAKYQELNAQGMIGNIMARGMAKTLGLDSPDFLRAATYSPSQIRGNQEYGQQVNARLGLDAAQIGRLSQEIPLGMARLSTGLQAVSQKIVGIALPYLEQGLNRASTWLGQNASRIGEWIETAGNFLFNVAPGLIQAGLKAVTGGIAWGVDTFIAVSAILRDQLPTILGGVVDWTVTALSNFYNYVQTNGPRIVAGVANFLIGVGRNFGNFLVASAKFVEGLSNTSNPWRQAIEGVAQGLDLGVIALKSFAGTLNATWAAVENGIKTSPFATALKAVGITNIAGFDISSPARNVVDAYKSGFNAIPATDILSAVQNVLNSSAPADTGKWLREQAKAQNDFLNAMAANVTKYGNPLVSGLLTGTANLHNAIAGTAANGGKNKGRVAGEYLSGIFGDANKSAQGIKPYTDSLANLASGATSKGAESKIEKQSTQLDQLIKLQQEQVNIAKQALASGRELPRQTAALLGYALFTEAEAEGRGILSQR